MQRNLSLPSPLSCDAIDKIWLHIARQLGFVVARGDAAYASSDGHGTILIGTKETLDDDDCVAQLVFHELCHAIVQGEENLRRVDWGMHADDERDISREHAALRLQADMAGRYGLRILMLPTTVWRAYYDSLSDDALEGVDAGAALVQIAVKSELFARWQPFLRVALARTVAELSEVHKWVTAKERAFRP